MATDNGLMQLGAVAKDSSLSSYTSIPSLRTHYFKIPDIMAIAISRDVSNTLLVNEDVESCDVREVDAIDCCFSGVRVINSKLYSCILIDCQILLHRSIKDGRLRGCTIVGSILAESNGFPRRRSSKLSKLINVSISGSKIFDSTLNKCYATSTTLNSSRDGASIILESALADCKISTNRAEGKGGAIFDGSIAVNSSFGSAEIKKSKLTTSSFSHSFLSSTVLTLCVQIKDTVFNDNSFKSCSLEKCKITGDQSAFDDSKAHSTKFDKTSITNSAIRQSKIVQCKIQNCDPVQTSEIIQAEAQSTVFNPCKITKSVMIDSRINECGEVMHNNTLENCAFIRPPLALSRWPLELLPDLFSKFGLGDTGLIVAMTGKGHFHEEAMRAIYIPVLPPARKVSLSTKFPQKSSDSQKPSVIYESTSKDIPFPITISRSPPLPGSGPLPWVPFDKLR
ncbi:hypothetical protein BKA64DRAFT_763050 [Cadophora sp. MPI-SDFR-AT-0126]|nr:hypothetical protein BKA64DRAFT_763050 [Leotiomycetes sp. MPI-SDFR-AT-0126]